MTSEQSMDRQRRAVLESIYGRGTFLSPEHEYDHRASDFRAEIPQTGERWDSREALMDMQRAFGAPPAVQLQEIRGQGDLWVVETIQTYEGDGDYDTCVIVEFRGDKITRETRYYAAHSSPPVREGGQHA